MPDKRFDAMRLRGFLRKETLQILRDPSSILLGIVMPVVLLFLFGYGVSLDPHDVPVALVIQDDSAPARDLAARFELSSYFAAVRVPTAQHARILLQEGRVDGIVHLRDSPYEPDGAPVQLVVDGIDANRARLIQGYAQGALAAWHELRAARGEPVARPAIEVRDRIWFNASGNSTHFLVPGLLTLIMTLIGTLLTALVIAREWERGTMEALLATPLSTDEFLLGKLLPYFALGMTGMALCVGLGMALFGVPLRGSLLLLMLFASLFLLASLGIGLLISALTRVQFVAAQASVIAGFLPAFFLSGLLFDLESTPKAIQVISHIVPARYFVTISHSLFLAGNVWSVLLPAGGVLALMATVLLAGVRRKITGRLPT